MLERDTQPFSLADIVGNYVTMTELMERSLTLDFPDVMIFAGPSGTGKTTTAYIIAALLAKDNAVDAERLDINPMTGVVQFDESGSEHMLRFKDPRPGSPASLDIRDQRFARDVAFYNAATLGKDGVLGLEERLAYGALQDGHRTIIIDEAQEISKAGKGAALTILEKKRRDATIILCTMDLGAFDRAVRSRARVYNFTSPSPAEISAYLARIIEQSPVDFAKLGMPPEFFRDGLAAIAFAANGSVREAVGMLDRALVGQLWDVALLQRELGVVTRAAAGSLLEALYKRKARAVELLEALPAEEAFRQLRRQVLAIKRFQVVGSPREDSDQGICAAFGAEVAMTDRLLEMIGRIEAARYVSDELLLRETLLFLRPLKTEPMRLFEEPPVRAARRE